MSILMTTANFQPGNLEVSVLDDSLCKEMLIADHVPGLGHDNAAGERSTHGAAFSNPALVVG